MNGLAAVSSYYGGGVANTANVKLTCPVVCHFGGKDPYIQADKSEAAVKAAHPEVPVYVYANSGHGFNNEGPDADPAEVKLARNRTLTLFEANCALPVKR